MKAAHSLHNPQGLRLKPHPTAAPMWYIILAALPFIWRALGALLHRVATQKVTVLNELPALGTSRKDGKLRGTAVVAGGRYDACSLCILL
jgi:hypothetical protein